MLWTRKGKIFCVTTFLETKSFQTGQAKFRRKFNFNCKNRRAKKVQDLRRELRALKKKYKQGSEGERQPLTELREILRTLPVILIQTWLSASECTHTRYRIKTSLWYVYLYNSPRLGEKWRKSFLIGQYHFKNSLEVAFKFFFLLRCELCEFACWAYFYFRIAGWNNNFGRVTWESKYDVWKTRNL